jgi:uncharacterized protein Smg (DUF494 family)
LKRKGCKQHPNWGEDELSDTTRKPMSIEEHLVWLEDLADAARKLSEDQTINAEEMHARIEAINSARESVRLILLALTRHEPQPMEE